jgi:hypothetical protein
MLRFLFMVITNDEVARVRHANFRTRLPYQTVTMPTNNASSPTAACLGPTGLPEDTWWAEQSLNSLPVQHLNQSSAGYSDWQVARDPSHLSWSMFGNYVSSTDRSVWRHSRTDDVNDDVVTLHLHTSDVIRRSEWYSGHLQRQSHHFKTVLLHSRQFRRDK